MEDFNEFNRDERIQQTNKHLVRRMRELLVLVLDRLKQMALVRQSVQHMIAQQTMANDEKK